MDLCTNYSTLPLQRETSHRHYTPHCVPKLDLWTLTFECYLIFMFQDTLFFWFLFPAIKKCKNHFWVAGYMKTSRGPDWPMVCGLPTCFRWHFSEVAYDFISITQLQTENKIKKPSTLIKPAVNLKPFGSKRCFLKERDGRKRSPHSPCFSWGTIFLVVSSHFLQVRVWVAWQVWKNTMGTLSSVAPVQTLLQRITP